MIYMACIALGLDIPGLDLIIKEDVVQAKFKSVSFL